MPGDCKPEPLLLHHPHDVLAREQADRAGDAAAAASEHAALTCRPLPRAESYSASSTTPQARPSGNGCCSSLMKRRFIGNATSTPSIERHDVEAHDLPPRQHGVGRPHVRRYPRGQWHRHVTRRRRDRLRAVVLEDRHVARARAATAMRNIANARITEVRPTPSVQPVLAPTYRLVALSTPPSKNPVSRRAQRELRHVAAVDVLEPPAVFLLAGPGADLLLGEVRKRHRRVVLGWVSRIAALSRLRDSAYAAVLVDAPSRQLDALTS